MQHLFNKSISKSATFSDCRTWRYRLYREWDSDLKKLVCIGLNPSTADEIEDDPTIRRVLAFAKRWGFGSLVMLNLFAYRDTDPEKMRAHESPVGPDNDQTIREEVQSAGMILAAWGDSGGALGRERGKAVMQIVRESQRFAYCLGVTQGFGSPRHPLYVPGDFQPVVYQG